MYEFDVKPKPYTLKQRILAERWRIFDATVHFVILGIMVLIVYLSW